MKVTSFIATRCCVKVYVSTLGTRIATLTLTFDQLRKSSGICSNTVRMVMIS